MGSFIDCIVMLPAFHFFHRMRRAVIKTGSLQMRPMCMTKTEPSAVLRCSGIHYQLRMVSGGNTKKVTLSKLNALSDTDPLKRNPDQWLKIEDGQSLPALQELAELLWQSDALDPITRRRVMLRYESWLSRTQRVPLTNWRLVYDIRQDVAKRCNDIEVGNIVASLLAKCFAREDFKEAMDIASAHTAQQEGFRPARATIEGEAYMRDPGKVDTGTGDDITSLPATLRAPDDLPLYFSADLLPSSQEDGVGSATANVHAHSVAHRPPDATKIADKLVPDVVCTLESPLVPPEGSLSSTRAIVCNLPTDVSEEDIAISISPIGDVRSVQIFDERGWRHPKVKSISGDSNDQRFPAAAGSNSAVHALIEFVSPQSVKDLERFPSLRLFGMLCESSCAMAQLPSDKNSPHYLSAYKAASRNMYVESARFKRTVLISGVPWQFHLHEVLEMVGKKLASGGGKVCCQVKNAKVFELDKGVPLSSLSVNVEKTDADEEPKVHINMDPTLDNLQALDGIDALKTMEEEKTKGSSSKKKSRFVSEANTSVDDIVSRRVVLSRHNDGLFCLRFPSFEAASTAVKLLQDLTVADRRVIVQLSPKRLQFVPPQTIEDLTGVAADPHDTDPKVRGWSEGVFVDFLLPERSAVYDDVEDMPILTSGLPAWEVQPPAW